MTAIPECPAHSGPGGWYDHGCRGCVAARLAQTERSLSAMNAENLRLTAALSQARDRAVELDFAAERALDMLQSGRHYDAEATLETVLGNGSNDNPHESDGTPPEACTYCGDVWPCAGSQNGSDPSPERHK